MRNSVARTWIVFVATLSFMAGVVAMAGFAAIFPESTMPERTIAATPLAVATPSAVAMPPPETAPQAAVIPVMPLVGPDPIEVLRSRHLGLPVQGAQRSDVRDMFNERRGTDRRHEAIDMLARWLTPVVAVEEGTIAKLFFSKAGGITVYQFDPSATYAYYYAHLERYAEGLAEGAQITRGQVIGYVGTSGNAPPDTPHLHFAIFQLNAEKRWWQGTAIDPYQVLR